MKQKPMTKKLTINKETVSNLELGNVSGGKNTDFSECGTAPATFAPCLCDDTQTLLYPC